MDETSFTTVAVGESTGSHVMEEASVVDGKISVRKLAITGVGEAEGSTANIYPNPAGDHIRLTFPDNGAVRTIILSDMTGRIVQSIKTHSPEAIMKVSEIQEGMYKLQIHKNGISVKTVKVLIE